MIGLLTLVVIAGGKWRYGVISALFGFTLATVGVDLGTGINATRSDPRS